MRKPFLGYLDLQLDKNIEILHIIYDINTLGEYKYFNVIHNVYAVIIQDKIILVGGKPSNITKKYNRVVIDTTIPEYDIHNTFEIKQNGLEGLKEKLLRKIYNKRLINPLIPIVYTLEQLYSMELLPFCNVLCEKMYPTVEDIDNSVNKRFSKVNSKSYSNLYQKLIEESHIAQYRMKCKN